MTLGSRLSASASAWPRRDLVRRLSPATPRAAVVRRVLLRAQSTDAGAANGSPSASASASASSREASSSSSSSSSSGSLIDRIRRVPVRPRNPGDSVVIRPVNNYDDRRENHEELQRAHRARIQQRRIERNRRRVAAPDWRVILNTLVRRTPVYERPKERVEVVVPPLRISRLFGDNWYNVWNIKSRTGCNMELRYADSEAAAEDQEQQQAADHPGMGNKSAAGKAENAAAKGGSGAEEGRLGEPMSIFLSGQPAAVSAAVADILKATQSEVTVIRLRPNEHATVLHDGSKVHTRFFDKWIASPETVTVPDIPSLEPCEPYILTTRADEIPQPAKWTIESFFHYVAALTMARLPPGLGKELYGTGNHYAVVVERLHSLFHRPDVEKAVSLPAFKLALSFLTRAGETYVNEANALIRRYRVLGLRLDADVFNLIAETAVKAKNLLGFQNAMEDMRSARQRPNLRTWVLFLRMIEAEDAKRYILEAMHSRNMLEDPGAVLAVSNEMAPHDAYRAVKMRQDLDTFLDSLQELYGPEWRLTRSAANQMLTIFGRHGQLDTCRDLLNALFETEDEKPDAISLNTVITHCRNQNKIDEAIKVLQMFEEHGLNVADGTTMHLLLTAARKAKKPYLFSAVWRYAHFTGTAVWRVRYRGDSLLSGGPGVEKLTDRIQSFWGDNGQYRCNISRQKFIDNLLLHDYLTLSKEHVANRQNYAAEMKAEYVENPEMARVFRHRNPFVNQPPLPWEEGEAQPMEAEEAREAERMSEAEEMREVEEGEMASPDRGSERPPWSEKYDAFAEWVAQYARDMEPEFSLGDFLQEALDRDRAVHSIAWRGRMPLTRGLPVDLLPPDLPLRKRRGPRRNFMLGYLGAKVGDRDRSLSWKKLRALMDKGMRDGEANAEVAKDQEGEGKGEGEGGGEGEEKSAQP